MYYEAILYSYMSRSVANKRFLCFCHVLQFSANSKQRNVTQMITLKYISIRVRYFTVKFSPGRRLSYVTPALLAACLAGWLLAAKIAV